jgi:hypothetical protein
LRPRRRCLRAVRERLDADARRLVGEDAGASLVGGRPRGVDDLPRLLLDERLGFAP